MKKAILAFDQLGPDASKMLASADSSRPNLLQRLFYGLFTLFLFLAPCAEFLMIFYMVESTACRVFFQQLDWVVLYGQHPLAFYLMIAMSCIIASSAAYISFRVKSFNLYRWGRIQVQLDNIDGDDTSKENKRPRSLIDRIRPVVTLITPVAKACIAFGTLYLQFQGLLPIHTVYIIASVLSLAVLAISYAREYSDAKVADGVKGSEHVGSSFGQRLKSSILIYFIAPLGTFLRANSYSAMAALPLSYILMKWGWLPHDSALLWSGLMTILIAVPLGIFEGGSVLKKGYDQKVENPEGHRQRRQWLLEHNRDAVWSIWLMAVLFRVLPLYHHHSVQDWHYFIIFTCVSLILTAGCYRVLGQGHAITDKGGHASQAEKGSSQVKNGPEPAKALTLPHSACLTLPGFAVRWGYSTTITYLLLKQIHCTRLPLALFLGFCYAWYSANSREWNRMIKLTYGREVYEATYHAQRVPRASAA